MCAVSVEFPLFSAICAIYTFAIYVLFFYVQFVYCANGLWRYGYLFWQSVYAEKYVLLTKSSNVESECDGMYTRDRLRFAKEL